MAKLLALYPEPTDRKAFDTYYAQTHAPLALRVPGLRSYSVSSGAAAVISGNPYYLVAELTFDSLASLQAGLESAEGRAARDDLANFAPAGTTILVYETRELVGRPA